MKTYSELIELPTFEERFRFLQSPNAIGSATLGSLRWLAEEFYHSKEWRDIKRYIIMRDGGCDLAISDRSIDRGAVVHHIKPLSAQDFQDRTMFLLDPEFMVLASDITHKAIHYGDEHLLMKSTITRRSSNDTSPWRQEAV